MHSFNPLEKIEQAEQEKFLLSKRQMLGLTATPQLWNQFLPIIEC
jgi:hypothetical protein